MKRSRQRRLHIMRRGLWYSLALCLWILLIGGVGFWLLEPGIDTLQDGLWLAFTTAATVGYGDMVPRTPARPCLCGAGGAAGFGGAVAGDRLAGGDFC
jgi:voltage-gated potassium channel